MVATSGTSGRPKGVVLTHDAITASARATSARLGVEPAARIAIVSYSGNYVWIESGYTWLLWGGGIPLLASYLFFTWVTVKQAWRVAWADHGARSVAGTAVFVATIVIAVLMIFDPHLTYRGSADDFFFLIALMAPRGSHEH